MGLNLIWTPLYFSLGAPIAATADIVALFGTVAYLANIWGQVDPVCGWLLAPYLGWISFATYLCVRAIIAFTSRLGWLTSTQVGSGYLNNWDFSSALKKKD